MFTLKLTEYFAKSTGHRTHIVSAEAFTLFWYDGPCCQITSHQKDVTATQVYYVGDKTVIPHSIGDQTTVYHRAIIENGAGKTTEYIEPPRFSAVSHGGGGINVAGP